LEQGEGTSYEHLVEDHKGERVMKQREGGSCMALDRKTMLCIVYAHRPNTCREFGPDDNQKCIDSVYKRQKAVMSAAAEQVEAVLRAAVDFALVSGFSPTVHSKYKSGETDVQIFLQPSTMGLDVRPQALNDALKRIRENLALYQTFIEVPRA
jgi:Fe-S-cluster containining protein